MKIFGFIYSLRDILQETPVARAMETIFVRAHLVDFLEM